VCDAAWREWQGRVVREEHGAVKKFQEAERGLVSLREGFDVPHSGNHILDDDAQFTAAVGQAQHGLEVIGKLRHGYDQELDRETQERASHGG
jgi:hypothetical protein